MSSFANVLALAAGLVSGVTAPDSAGRAFITAPSWFFGNVRLGYEAPDVELWVSGDNLFRRGDRARVYFRTEEDAYVTIVRIDTDGRVDILFPEDPYDDNEVRGGHTYRVYGHGQESFVINDYPGMGYIFAIASWDRFDYDRVSRGRRWDYDYAGGRVHGDPYLAARDFADMLLDARSAYSFDVAEYHVERRVTYPRFLCYDCHAYRPYHVWNPYSHACVKFRVVVWDDPYYYPYRRYGGRRVVYVRERVREPRYEFKELPRGTRPSDVTLVEHRRRPSNVDQRRPGLPAVDDNVVGRRRNEGSSGRGSGATRPGDDVRDQPVSGRRRATELDRDMGGEGQSPIRTPRRDATPRDDERGSEDSRGPIREPRRDEPSASVERDRVDDRVIIEDRGRREPRSEEPRAEPRRDDAPREPSGQREPRREQPRAEPRREQPRAEPRREQPRPEPKSAPSRQSAPKETPRRSTPSNGSGRRT